MRNRWLQRALDEAAAAAAYIAEDRRNAAGRWREGLIDVSERIARYPESGRAVPELDRSDLREVIYGSFRVIYMLADGPVILAVRHSRRRLTKRELRDWMKDARDTA
jgi:toxin ParE1/3/4